MRRSLLLCLLVARAAAQTTPGPAAPTPAAPPPIVMSQVEVTEHQQAQLNSIDRKTYLVGQDVQGVTGTAADVLQNIPSVDLDIDGNVSLRGDSNVLVLIDGRPSALMNSTNRADVLSSLPADSIERIEVITNPSARFKPDGSAGIINIVMKKRRKPGVSGTVRLTGGNDDRWGGSAGANYNPGAYNLAGNLNVRKDDRDRITTERRTYTDPSTGLPATEQTRTTEQFRPLFEIGEAEVDADAGPLGQLSGTVDYTNRQQHRNATETLASSVGSVPTDYDRLRNDPEYERYAEAKASLDHEFGRKDDTLNLAFRWEHDTERDHNLYTDVFSVPAAPSTSTRTLVEFNEPTTELSADYSNTLDPDRKVEAGFDRLDDRWNKNVLGTDFNPATGLWVVDPTITNDFVAEQVITAAYGTYQQRFGKFTAMPGLRLEAVEVDTNQLTQGIVANQRYDHAYPTLHLAYELTDTEELQLNYSERVNRPDDDDLNPFSEFQDPTSLRVGNPHLRPEEVHSVEAGDQYKRGDTTLLAALFYRDAVNSFTTVTQILNSTTLVTTEENLGHNQSGGAEFAATVSPWKPFTLNASASAYYNEIDASNLGYTSNRGTYTWSGKFSGEYDWGKATAVQFSANYNNRRLTPQGYRLPTFVANLGVKHELRNQKLAVFFTVSDLFNSLKEETRLDTPTLHDDYTRRRSSRFFSVGAIYTFGSAKKKGKSDTLEFDNKL
jgi:outer membrane receptor protein involved in Fe transport